MRKKITYNEVISNKHFSSYEEAADYVLGLIADGELEPIRSSSKTGKYPSLYTRYWKKTEDTDYSVLVDELRNKVSARIDIDYYLSHLDVYESFL